MWILTLEPIHMLVMSVANHSVTEPISSFTVRYILVTGLSPVMCVGRLSERAGTLSCIIAHTQENGLINVKCVRNRSLSAPRWLYTNVCTQERDPTNVTCAIMTLCARPSLQSTKKPTRSAPQLTQRRIYNVLEVCSCHGGDHDNYFIMGSCTVCLESDRISKWCVNRELQKQWVEQYTETFFSIFLTFHVSFCDLFLWNKFNEWRAFNKALSWLEIDFCFKAMVLSILCLSSIVCFCIVTRGSSVFCQYSPLPYVSWNTHIMIFFPVSWA